MQAGGLISGKYRLLRVLGAGSMGSVWAARNELTNRDFAVKFLLPEQSQNQDALNRFFLEARACGQIRHPAIVDVYDMGQADDGAPFLVMELLEGEGFDARLARIGKLRPVDACRWVALISRGLEEAHTRGLIHRDLKPGNIFFAIDKGGGVFPKVLDFGISKEVDPSRGNMTHTSTGAVLGSPAYMSPEQASGEIDIDARADIWALGIILYEALSGALPFDAANYNALMVAITTHPHQPLEQIAPDVPAPLCELVNKLLQKDRAARVGSAGELADRLEHIYAGLTDTPLSSPERQPSIAAANGATTQQGWLTVPTATGGSRLSPAFMVGAALALGGLVFGGIALGARGPGGPAIAPAARFGSAADAIVARAETEYTAAMGQQQTAEAEAKAAQATKEAADAKEKLDDEKNRDARTEPGPRVRPQPGGSDPHGGVDGPGF